MSLPAIGLRVIGDTAVDDGLGEGFLSGRSRPVHAESYQLAGGWQRLEKAGQGATAIVWRARDDSGRIAALKIALPGDESAAAVAREATRLARTARRWGPALVDAGPGYLAIEWVDGRCVTPAALDGDREKRSAVVAHGVARAPEEPHDARVRHGDVKPANGIEAGSTAVRDARPAGGAPLAVLGLSPDAGEGPRGGTLRYAAPELRGGEGGIAADLWALGLLIAEVLDARVASASDPRAAMQSWGRAARAEPARWAEPLVPTAPRARPRPPRSPSRPPPC